ncbi:MAG TPA: phospholipase D-like domain-containing protein [Rhabdochlamydiaceae bacterium]|jgi:phosphatidylserine/phosphatidylglycerophosphate/cardiolipin synthase-like enzyme
MHLHRFLRNGILSTALLCAAAPCFAQSETSSSCVVYFSHEEPLDEKFIALIDAEKTSIQLSAYCLRSARIAKALTAAQKRGVLVEIVVDPYSVKASSPLKRLSDSKIPLYVWNASSEEKSTSGKKKNHRNALHDSFCLFGGKKIWTGSFYFAQSGAEHATDCALVLEKEDIAKAYSKEFNRIKGQAVSYLKYTAD